MFCGKTLHPFSGPERSAEERTEEWTHMVSTPAGTREPPTPLNGEITEMLLLLPTAQAAALERMARRHGLTSGQLARRLIGEFLARSSSACGAEEDGNP
jgi:hypothetical protein